MPRFEVKQSAKLNLTSYSGLALIGQCCQAAQVEAVIDPKLPVSQRMKTSYLALLRADSGFDSARLLFAKAAERDRWAAFMPNIIKAVVQFNAAQFVGIAYRGILAREADPSGLVAYSKWLRRNADLAGQLAEIARSDEHWQKQFAARAPDLVRALYLGLLGREPEAEELHEHAAQLMTMQDVPLVLHRLGSSAEFANKVLQDQAEKIVRSAYRGILRREPDEGGLQHHIAALRTHGDLAVLLRGFV